MTAKANEFGWVEYRTPTVPYTIVDAINRYGVATGSIGGAIASHGADFNGFAIKVDTGARAGWRAHYTWAGLHWLTTGASFQGALDTALRAPEGKAKGGWVGVTFKVSVRAGDEDSTPSAERVAAVLAAGLLPEDEAKAKDAAWQDWRFAEVPQAFSWDRNFGTGAVGMLANAPASETREAFWARVSAADRARRAPRAKARA